MAFYIIAAFIIALLALPVGIKTEINVNRSPGFKIMAVIAGFKIDLDGGLKHKNGRYTVDFGRTGGKRHSQALDVLKNGSIDMGLALHSGQTALRFIMTNLRTEKLLLHIRLGTGDAAETAVLGGLAGILAAALCSVADIRPDVEVYPDFGRKIFMLHFEGMFFMRLGHIIGAGITGAAEYCKGAFGKWTTQHRATRLKA